PLPGALRHAPMRLGQAAAWRIEAARHGLGFLPEAGGPPSRHRHPNHGKAARHGARAPALAQAEKLCRDSLSVRRGQRRSARARTLPLGSWKKATHSSMPFLPKSPASSRWIIDGGLRKETPLRFNAFTASSISTTRK